jgi:hypothetical protein
MVWKVRCVLFLRGKKSFIAYSSFWAKVHCVLVTITFGVSLGRAWLGPLLGLREARIACCKPPYNLPAPLCKTLEEIRRRKISDPSVRIRCRRLSPGSLVPNRTDLPPRILCSSDLSVKNIRDLFGGLATSSRFSFAGRRRGWAGREARAWSRRRQPPPARTRSSPSPDPRALAYRSAPQFQIFLFCFRFSVRSLVVVVRMKESGIYAAHHSINFRVLLRRSVMLFFFRDFHTEYRNICTLNK